MCFQTEYKLGLLITGKSHSRDESRNYRVSIETLDFAPVRNFTCVIGVGSPAWARRGGGDRGSATDDWSGNHRLPPPVERRWTIGRRCGRYGRVKRRAAAGHKPAGHEPAGHEPATGGSQARQRWVKSPPPDTRLPDRSVSLQNQ